MIIFVMIMMLIGAGYGYGRWRDEREINRMIDRYFSPRLSSVERLEVRRRYFGR